MAHSPKLATSLAQGIEIIRQTVKTLPQVPGVYRMINNRGEVVYVGKAKDLKKRVVSYTFALKLPLRLQRMVSETVSMEIVTTHTETEALLLESNLIKKLQPHYNILLKDFSLYFNHPRPCLSPVRKAPGASTAKREIFWSLCFRGCCGRNNDLAAKSFSPS